MQKPHAKPATTQKPVKPVEKPAEKPAAQKPVPTPAQKPVPVQTPAPVAQPHEKPQTDVKEPQAPRLLTLRKAPQKRPVRGQTIKRMNG